MDSFFLNGSPAPLTLLNAFSVSQGQQSNVQHSYQFYRKGTFSYLMRLNYGSDATFTILANGFVNTDNVAPDATQDIQANSFQSFCYPNPLQGTTMHVMLSGQTEASLHYTLITMSGAVLDEGMMSGQGTVFQFTLKQKPPSGTYFLQVQGACGHGWTETVQVVE